MDGGDFSGLGGQTFHFERMGAYMSHSFKIVVNWQIAVRGSPTHILFLKNKKTKKALQKWNIVEVADLQRCEFAS